MTIVPTELPAVIHRLPLGVGADVYGEHEAGS